MREVVGEKDAVALDLGINVCVSPCSGGNDLEKPTLLIPHVCALIQKTQATQTQP